MIVWKIWLDNLIVHSAQEEAVYGSHFERCGRLFAEAKNRIIEQNGVIESVVDRVRTLCVHRDWRGCGLASVLIRAREQLAKVCAHGF